MDETNKRFATRPALPRMRRGTPDLRLLAVAAALATASFGAEALTLGAIQVQSALGQPLVARIDVPQITAAESSSLTFSMGSSAEYKAAGLVYDPALAGVQVAFVPGTRGGPAHIEVTGTRPVNAPLVNLIISANWASGQVNRNYALFLDPPGGVAPKPTLPVAAASAQAPITASQTTPAPGALAPSVTGTPARMDTAPTPAAPPLGQLGRVREIPAPRHAIPSSFGAQESGPSTPSGRAPRAGVTQPGQGPGTTASTGARRAPARVAPETSAPRSVATVASANRVTVKRGDTAFGLVRSHVTSEVSLDQLLAALLSTNPDAFVRSDINRLRTGAELDLPTQAEATSRSSQEARAFLTAQARDFDAYRAKAAAHVTARANPTPSEQTSAGAVQGAHVDNKSATNTPSDWLSVSKGGGGDAIKTTSESIQREISALNSRVAELQRNLSDLEKLGTETTTANGQSGATDATAPSGNASSTDAPKDAPDAADDANTEPESTSPDAASMASQSTPQSGPESAVTPSESTTTASAPPQLDPASTPAAAPTPTALVDAAPQDAGRPHNPGTARCTKFRARRGSCFC